MDPHKLMACLETVRRGSRLPWAKRLIMRPETWAEFIVGGELGTELTERGLATLRARPIPEAELALLRAAAKGEGRRVAKAHERPTLAALVAWGLVADSSGAKIVVTAWGADVLAHHSKGETT